MQKRQSQMSDEALEVLSAFTAMQNWHEGALTPAEYGYIFRPDAKNANQAFYELVKSAAQEIVNIR